MTLLAVPEHFIMLDLTVHMDIHPQPGPELTSDDSGKRDTMLRKTVEANRVKAVCSKSSNVEPFFPFGGMPTNHVLLS